MANVDDLLFPFLDPKQSLIPRTNNPDCDRNGYKSPFPLPASPHTSSPNPLMEVNQQQHSLINVDEPGPGPGPDPDPNSTLRTRLRARLCSCGWQGAKPVPLLVCVALGLIIRFAVPKPDGVTAQAWQLLAIFMTTVAGLVLAPLPVGAWSFVCLTGSMITKTLSFEQAFTAMTNEVIWLIVVAFFFSRGFVKTGLGDRVATCFIRWLGRRTVGLSYGMVLCEAFVAAAIPSSTARAGGVFSPVINSVAVNSGSLARDKSAKKLGSFLVMAQMQVCFLLSIWHFSLTLSSLANCFVGRAGKNGKKKKEKLLHWKFCTLRM